MIAEFASESIGEIVSRLEDLFPSARRITSARNALEWRFHLDADRLDCAELGRLLILNGRCRAEGTRLVLFCPAALARQLIDLELHRIIWIEEG